MRTNIFCLLAIGLATISTDVARGSVIIDFEGLGPEFMKLRTLDVTDPHTGEMVTVEFRTLEAGRPVGRPILVEEGMQNGVNAGFDPDDTPFGEVLGNGNDWMLGNGRGVSENYQFKFIGNKVANISLQLIDFRSDGPFSLGTPGSDFAALRAYDENFNEFPFVAANSRFVSPNPRPEDGNVVQLSTLYAGISEARLIFTPDNIDAGIVIDNLSFTVIPEPGAPMLLLTALAAFGLRRRLSLTP